MSSAPTEISFCAEAACIFRYLSTLDPDPKTRNPDHMAEQFVNMELAAQFPGFGLDFKDAKLVWDQMGTGVIYYANARTHHIDASLTAALKAGFKQVIIMGAGFDSRSYRFHTKYPEVRFFEIDLPATSADKQRRVEKLLGKEPDWVTFIPIDFNTQNLDEVLSQVGCTVDQRTFYVWEGVTYFVSRNGVENTLGFIAEHSAPKSQVIFDYMLEDVVQGIDYSAHGARRTVDFVSGTIGEPYIFGIDPQKIETFINLRGLAFLSDLGPADLTQCYLICSDGKALGKIAGFLRIVLAEVPDSSEGLLLTQKAKKQMKRIASDNVLTTKIPRVPIPDEVQAFLNDYSSCIERKDFNALIPFYSEDFRDQGLSRDQVVTQIRNVYLDSHIDQAKIVLTKFKQKENRASIDGYIQRYGFRTPLMVLEIIKEADGRWRWYGDQT